MRRARDIPSPIINLRIAVAESLGANKQDLLNEINIDPNILSNPRGRVTVEQTMHVWRTILKHTGCDTIGVECGLRTRFQTMGILGYVMMNSASIFKAFNKLCTYQELVLSIMLQTVETKDGKVYYQGKMQEEWQDEFRYTMDFIYVSFLTLIKHCSSTEIYPIEIGFNYPKPKSYKRYEEVFSPAIVKFSCQHPYIIYNQSDLENRITGTDSNLLTHFDTLLQDAAREHDKINIQSRAVRKSILKRLMAEIPKIDEVARELTMSVRSLQSSLRKEGTTFQKILNEVRKEIAVQQLSRPDLSVTDVAFLIGFSDISVFSRNFKKWTGYTPSEFQNKV